MSLMLPIPNKKKEFPVPYFKFCLSEYYKRIDEVFSQIIADKEDQPCLVLWWGNDGLRLNKDGTTEWIKRNINIEKNKYISDSFFPGFNTTSQNKLFLYNLADITQSTQSQLDKLRADNLCLQIQASQMYQNSILMLGMQNIQNSIVRNTFPASSVTECCCGLIKDNKMNL